MFIIPISTLLAVASAVDPVGGALLTKLFEEHNERMLYIAGGILNNHEDAEDAVALTFEKVWKHIDSFENKKDDELKKLLTTYVVNTAKDVRKNKKCQKE